MKTFLTFLLLLAAVPFANAEQSKSVNNEPLTFVIVHGATGGGWDWKTVAQLLSEKGHTVYRPTLTGLGEKHHLADKNIDLDTHITDIVNLIQFEELDNIVLAGHSYGGMVISGVMNTMPEKLKHVIFLDAAVPDDGMSAVDVWGMDVSSLKITDGMVMFDWLDNAQPPPRDMPHPLRSITQAVQFDNPKAKEVNATFIAFISPESSEQERAKDPSWQRAKQRGWSIRTFAGDHVVYREKPVEFVEMLLESVNDKNQTELSP